MKTAINPLITLRREVERFENKYGMRFEEFSGYLHQRSDLLISDDLPQDQRLPLSRAIMQEEDDWLDWKASQEMLDRWPLRMKSLERNPINGTEGLRGIWR